MKLKTTSISAFFVALSSFFVVSQVHAQEALERLSKTGDIAYGKAPSTDVMGALTSIIKILTGAVGVIFFILLLYAGFLYMTAAGEEDKTSKAKKLITSGIIGMIIFFSAYAVSIFLEGNFGIKTP